MDLTGYDLEQAEKRTVLHRDYGIARTIVVPSRRAGKSAMRAYSPVPMRDRTLANMLGRFVLRDEWEQQWKLEQLRQRAQQKRRAKRKAQRRARQITRGVDHRRARPHFGWEWVEI